MKNKIIEASNMLNDCIKQGKLIELYITTSCYTYQKRGLVNGFLVEADNITIDFTSKEELDQMDVLVFNLDDMQEIQIEEDMIEIVFADQMKIALSTEDFY